MAVLKYTKPSIKTTIGPALCRVLVGAILLVILADSSIAQIERLPPVTATQAIIEPVSYPPELSQPYVPPQEALQRTPLSQQKGGMLQRLGLTTTWLGRNDLGVVETEVYATLGFPFPTRESPLLVTPGFEFRFLDASGGLDVPERLHDAYVSFRWMRKFGERWGADIRVSPGLHSDFERWREDAIRVTGHGVASYTWSPELQLIMGVAYLDRDDVSLLPAAGVIWTPSDDMRYELLFPRPRIAKLLNFGPGFEDWAYVAAEFGGGSWSVTRTGGVQDVLTMRDYRAVIGFERKRDGGGGYRLEAAWVFGREVEYASRVGDFQPGATLMVRGGLTY